MNGNNVFSREKCKRKFQNFNHIFNRFKYQIIITERKTMDSHVYSTKSESSLNYDVLNSSEITKYLKQFPLNGQVAVFSNVNERKYYQFQQVTENLYQNRTNVKFFKCSYFAKDIEDFD